MEYTLQQLNPAMATLNRDLTVTLAPLKDIHPEGTYTFYIGGRLTDYGFYKQVAFQVKVTGCVAVLDLSKLTIPPIFNTWYDNELIYDITSFQPLI